LRYVPLHGRRGAIMRRGYRVASLRTLAEYRAAERRARMIRRLLWAALIVGIVGAVAIPCPPLAGWAC
jgi:hypothetical protein